MSEIYPIANLINYSEAARLLDVSRTTIYAMIERGELKPVAIAERRYLKRDEVEEMARACQQFEEEYDDKD